MKKLFIPLRKLLCCMMAALFLMHTAPAVSAGIQAEAMPAEPSDKLIGGEGSGLINILLIGQDRREENTIARSDSIILCSVHLKSKTITMTSFLRDLYVEIPGREGNRINAAYACGGMELLKQTLQTNFGIVTDGCIEVDFSRFSQIIDTLGGVSIELRQDEADCINHSLSSTLTAGQQQLTGEQALAYSRIRNLDADGDFSRTNRQRTLLYALLDSYRDAGLLTLLSAVVDTLPLITTDLDKKEILLLAAKLFPLLDDAAFVSQRIPADGSYAYSTIRNMEVLTADPEEIRRQLQQLLTVSDENVS